MKLVEHDGEAKWEVKQIYHVFGPRILGSYGGKVKDNKCSKVYSQLYIRTGGPVFSHHHFQCTHSFDCQYWLLSWLVIGLIMYCVFLYGEGSSPLL